MMENSKTIYMREWRRKNPEKDKKSYLKSNKKYKTKNKEKCLALTKKWRLENKDKSKE